LTFSFDAGVSNFNFADLINETPVQELLKNCFREEVGKKVLLETPTETLLNRVIHFNQTKYEPISRQCGVCKLSYTHKKWQNQENI